MSNRVSNDQNLEGASLKAELSAAAARQIAQLIQNKPDCNLGLPSGRTPVMMYKRLVDLTHELGLDWTGVNCFALDDYVDAPVEHSFQTFLTDNLYAHVNLPEAQRHNPSQVDDYDALIASYGGLDLTILGIGGNGHIAFNEPSTPRNSFTHCTFLEESTRRALQSNFGGFDRTPSRGVTMGIATILASKAIILLAFGEEKRAIVERAFANAVDESVPASFLQLHKQVTLLTDCR